MKKVLSVLLAAAMVMGMSVASFAAKETTKEFGNGTEGLGNSDANVEYITFTGFNLVRDGESLGWFDAKTSKDANLEAGDTLYFPLMDYTGKAIAYGDLDKDWRIKINNADYVSGASFFSVEDATDAKASGCQINEVAVKVVLEDDFDHYEEDNVKFFFQIYDRQKNNYSDRVEVVLNFADFKEIPLDKEDLNWVIVVDEPATYKYGKNEKAAKATIDFDGVAYTEFKMYAEEKYTLSSSTKYNKTLSKEYDTDVEVITFRMKNVENFDILFPSSKDNKQIVAVVDGELVPVEATYVEDHKFQSGKKADGYLVEDAEYLTYAVIDADVEIAVEEEVKDTTTEANKANPSTGANDFVGAAVALAVVSVAAAGALALKK